MHNIDYDLEYSKAMDKMVKGGEVKALFKMDTPTGEPSKLTYIQQLLVRTKAFKEWFGDWEDFANQLVQRRIKEDLKESEEMLKKRYDQFDLSKGNLSRNQLVLLIYFQIFGIKNLSYTIDYDTLEPQAYWHGTQAEEFFEFQTNVRNTGRPYSYFALNKSYSENFSKGKTLYSVFTCIKNPYIDFKYKGDKGFAFLSEVFIDYGLKNNLDSAQIEQITKDTKYKYVKDYVFNNFVVEDIQFWKLMARDNEGEFKRFLQELGYDGLMYVEEFREDADITKADEFTRAVTIFEPNQVKLADGRNTEFSALNNDIRYEKGGLIAPNGKKSNLTPEQYKLVRTPEFKKWFGDWENDPQNSSKVIDENGEPKVMYRGNPKEQEDLGYTFNLGYNFLNKKNENQFGFFFTDDIDVAKKYMKVSIWGEIEGGSITQVFLNIKNLFDLTPLDLFADGITFSDYLVSSGLNIVGYEELIKEIREYNYYENQEQPNIYNFFDKFPSLNKLFMFNKINGVIFKEKSRNYFSYSPYVVFHPNQIKLADGTNTKFNSESDDIRYAQGGSTKMDRYAHLLGIENNTPKFAEGGSVKTEHGMTNNGKKGGYFEGRPHSEGGIKAWNTTTNSPIEVEGGEVIITKKAVDDYELYEFEGEMLTNKQILSKINESGGGVKFEDGGEIHQCNCSGKMFKFGGETLEDYKVLNKMNQNYSKKESMKNRKTQYGHNLMRKMREGGFV